MLEKIRIFYFLLLMKPYHHHNHIYTNNIKYGYTSGFRECKYICTLKTFERKKSQLKLLFKIKF